MGGDLASLESLRPVGMVHLARMGTASLCDRHDEYPVPIALKERRLGCKPRHGHVDQHADGGVCAPTSPCGSEWTPAPFRMAPLCLRREGSSWSSIPRFA